MSDLNLYFRNTINMYKGELIRIMHEEEEGLLLSHYLGKDEMLLVNPKELTILNNVHLGWVNTPDGAKYIERYPLRSAKEGISIENLFIKPSFEGAFLPLMFPESFSDMFFNRYPTKDEALEQAFIKGHTVAYSKTRAFNRHGIEFEYYSMLEQNCRRLKNVSRRSI